VTYYFSITSFTGRVLRGVS